MRCPIFRSQPIVLELVPGYRLVHKLIILEQGSKLADGASRLAR